jgi:hypothetical protein
MKKRYLITTALVILILANIFIISSGLVTGMSEPTKSEMDESTGVAFTKDFVYFTLSKIKPEEFRYGIDFNVLSIVLNNDFNFLKTHSKVSFSKKIVFSQPPNFILNLVILA